MMTNLHRRALDDATAFAVRVTADDLTRPTPCAGWDLRALLAHVVGQHHGFAAAVTDPATPASAYADRPPQDWPREWHESVALLTGAFADAPPDRVVWLAEFGPDARLPVATVVGIHLLDTVVHAWDVATALGLPYRPDDELLDATAEVARSVPTGAAREQPGAPFGPPQSADTDDRRAATLAHLGRTAPVPRR